MRVPGLVTMRRWRLKYLVLARAALGARGGSFLRRVAGSHGLQVPYVRVFAGAAGVQTGSPVPGWCPRTHSAHGCTFSQMVPGVEGDGNFIDVCGVQKLKVNFTIH